MCGCLAICSGVSSGTTGGSGLVDSIETIRSLAKGARQGSGTDWQALSDYLAALPEDSLTDIARAFNQFLNLANIADQRHATSNGRGVLKSDSWRGFGLSWYSLLTPRKFFVAR